MIRYIFCISTGRCGTKYLQELFSTLDNCHAFHEQKPLLHHQIMRAYLNGKVQPLQSEMPMKVERIQETSSKLYVDTTHIYIKSFGWELPKYLPEQEIGVVVLKRKKEEVIKSTLRVGSGPFSFLGRKWILYPYRKAVIKPPISRQLFWCIRVYLKIKSTFIATFGLVEREHPKWLEKLSVKLVDWYYEETYALGEQYKVKYPKIKYVHISLDEINTKEGFEKIVDGFGLWSYYNPESLQNILGERKNLKL